MSSDWLNLTLDDVCEKITDGAHNSPKTVLTGKPMASVKDLTRFGVDLSEARLISYEDFDTLVKQGCQPAVGDVLIAKDGNSALDTVCTIDKPLDAVMLSSVAILRPNKEKLDPDFLKYYFCSKEIIDYLKSNFISGAAIPRVVLKDFRKAEIKTPPIEMQRIISRILRSLDNKIEINDQINKTLEKIAQAIFKSWFVDFEPVKAKIAAKLAGASAEQIERAALCVISGKTPEQLTQLDPQTLQRLRTTAALFPEAMMDSELGEIPVGWEVIPLYETAEYINGISFKNENFSVDKSGLPIIKIAELKQGLGANTKYTKIEVDSKYFITDDDVLYSWSGSPETSLEVFKWFGGDGWLNQHIFKLNFNSLAQKYFTYYLLKHMKPVLIATAQQKQTTGLGHVTVADMKRIKVTFPSEQVLLEFMGKVSFLYEKGSNNEKENRVLIEIRDNLLPKLLSGAINLSYEVGA